MPATSMSADAFNKLATSIQGFGDSEVGWGNGLSRAEIIRLHADQEKTRARAMVEQRRLASAQNRGETRQTMKLNSKQEWEKLLNKPTETISSTSTITSSGCRG